MFLNTSKALMAVACTVVGLVAGRYAGREPVLPHVSEQAEVAVQPAAAGSGSGAHHCDALLKFPLLAAPEGCRGARLKNKGPLTELEALLGSQLDAARSAGAVTRAAFYVRDLEDGPVAELHQDEPLAPASLLKLPVAMAVYDFATADPRELDRNILYDRAGVTHFDFHQQTFSFASDLKPGAPTPLRELIRSSLTYSDNLAFYLVLEQMNFVVPSGKDSLRRSFQELGIVDPPTGAEDVLTVHNYAVIFRSLYRGSYLGLTESQEILGFMAASPFDVGLAAGLPKQVKLAHKFGERAGEGSVKQLHDCGIVYLPGNPYQICVMSEGPAYGPLEQFIAKASESTYRAFAARR
jgi:beta-lactamase class A